jgi:hypothetical protein
MLETFEGVVMGSMESMDAYVWLGVPLHWRLRRGYDIFEIFCFQMLY